MAALPVATKLVHRLLGHIASRDKRMVRGKDVDVYKKLLLKYCKSEVLRSQDDGIKFR